MSSPKDKEKEGQEALLPDTSTWQLSDLTLKETLGTGTFGRVRLCMHKASGHYFAIKVPV